MESTNHEPDADTPERANPREPHRPRTELEQLAEDIVADRELLAHVLDAAGRTSGPMAPGDRKTAEEADRAHSPPGVPHSRTSPLPSQSYLHSAHAPSPHRRGPQSPPQGRENTTEEGKAPQTPAAYERSGDITPRQPTLGHPITSRSPTERSTAAHPTAASRTEPRQRTPGQPVPGHYTPGLLFTPGQYANYRPTPGQYTADYSTPGLPYTPGYPTPGQYPTAHHPTSHQYPSNNQAPPGGETKEEREARELEEYIAHGYDEEMREEHPEHFMCRLPDGTWAVRED